MKNQKRRKFIIKSAKIIATVFGTAVMGKYLLSPQTSEAANIDFQETHYGSKNNNGRKILVAYESQFGSTGEVADFIGKVLSQNGDEVEIKKNIEIENLATYDRVVIGSAIQYDKWMSEARGFVKDNEQILSTLPVAYFFTCLTLSKKTEKAKQKAIGYADKLYNLVPEVKPISVGRFAGVLDYSKMSAASRIMAKALFAVVGVKEGDYRDWDAIRSWAENIGF